MARVLIVLAAVLAMALMTVHAEPIPAVAMVQEAEMVDAELTDAEAAQLLDEEEADTDVEEEDEEEGEEAVDDEAEEADEDELEGEVEEEAAAPQPPTPPPKKPATPVAPPTTSGAIYGVDLSVGPSKESLLCFKSHTYKGKLSRNVPSASTSVNGPSYTAADIKRLAGADFSKVVFRSPILGGANLATSVANALSAGYKSTDLGAYFINFAASAGLNGVPAMITKITSGVASVATKINTLWLDVEGTLGSSMWTKSTTSNCAYLTAVVKGLKALQTSKKIPYQLGIYSGMYTWPTLMGSCSFAMFQDLPFWYAAYDSSKDTFSDWKPIKGAWQQPWGHQFHGTTNFCGASVDFNVVKTTKY